MDNIIWLTMRRMRTPLIVMILVYSLSVFGMVLIPGQDEAGRAVQMIFLVAAFFRCNTHCRYYLKYYLQRQNNKAADQGS